MIRLTRPEAGDALEEIGSVLKDGHLVQGKRVERFECLVAAYVGRKHGVAVNSGTSALQCAMMALGIGSGDEVIVPDFTFPASANAVIACGATPVLADIDLGTFNLSIDSVEANLSSRTRAIMPVDLFGLAADMKPLGELAAAKRLAVIEDSACALGSTFRAKKCGSFGDASVISFHPRKIVTTGEGGMILVDSDLHDACLRRLRNHGIDSRDGRTQFVLAGFNFRLSEIQACLGIAQMAEIASLIERRRRVARGYDRRLADVREIAVPIEPSGYLHTYQSYVVLVDRKLDRDRLIKAMAAAGVETAVGTYAIHLQPFFASSSCHRPENLASSTHAFMHSLALPIYASMDEETMDEVVSALKRCLHQVAVGN
jgi:perosamine synthetase